MMESVTYILLCVSDSVFVPWLGKLIKWLIDMVGRYDISENI